MPECPECCASLAVNIFTRRTAACYVCDPEAFPVYYERGEWIGDFNDVAPCADPECGRDKMVQHFCAVCSPDRAPELDCLHPSEAYWCAGCAPRYADTVEYYHRIWDPSVGTDGRGAERSYRERENPTEEELRRRLDADGARLAQEAGRELEASGLRDGDPVERHRQLRLF